jgi:hypothetical protein
MQRSLSDKLSRNFFNDPSQASLACVVNAPPVVNNPAAISGKEGQELFSQGRNLSLFQQKSLRVRRLYDEKRNVVVYVAYSTRLTSANDEGGASTGRYKCAFARAPRRLLVAFSPRQLLVAFSWDAMGSRCLRKRVECVCSCYSRV